jgi:hypothetical protein
MFFITLFLFLNFSKQHCYNDNAISIVAKMQTHHTYNILHLKIKNISRDTILCYGSKIHKKSFEFFFNGTLINDSCFEIMDTIFHPEESHHSNPITIVLLPNEIYTANIRVPKFTYSRCVYYRYTVAKNYHYDSNDKSIQEIKAANPLRYRSVAIFIDLNEQNY